jgi:predicted DNA-binding transcriptional regulator AlpA
MTAARFPVVGVAELGYMLNVNRARVGQLAAKPDFPRPVELKAGKVWWTEEIEAWAAGKGRVLRPLPASWPRASEDGGDGGAVTSSRYRT